MAGELGNKIPTSGSLLTTEVEEENQGNLGADLSSGGEDHHEDEEFHSPEFYCRFGLHPGMIPVPVQMPLSSNTGIMEGILEPEQERTTPKQGSGYVTLSDEPRLQEAKSSGMISGCHNDRRVSVSGSSGAASGYVPHRQFEKRDALALSQTAYQDYTKVFLPNIDDASTSTSV